MELYGTKTQILWALKTMLIQLINIEKKKSREVISAFKAEIV